VTPVTALLPRTPVFDLEMSFDEFSLIRFFYALLTPDCSPTYCLYVFLISFLDVFFELRFARRSNGSQTLSY